MTKIRTVPIREEVKLEEKEGRRKDTIMHEHLDSTSRFVRKRNFAQP